MRRLLGGILLTLGVADCTPRRPPAVRPAASTAAISSLDLLGEVSIPPLTAGARLLSARFGGISGLATDQSTGELLGITDDESDSRVFVFRVDAGLTPFRVELRAYFPLPFVPGVTGGQDAEGIAITRAGRLFIAAEGQGTREPRVPPGIVEYSQRTDYVGALAVPAKFIPPALGPATHGVRANAAFESLTLAPDEQRLFTATETALVQDGDPATTDHGTLARILEYTAGADGRFVPAREFAYAIEPLARPAFVPGVFINGLVELLALSDTELLSMERGYAEEAGGERNMTRIRIFRVSLADATDISRFDSIRDRRDVRAVRKTKLLDLSDVKGLSREASGLDNFEGMAFGPTLADGSRTLILVSDDNFNAKQRTWFLLFRIR